MEATAASKYVAELIDLAPRADNKTMSASLARTALLSTPNGLAHFVRPGLTEREDRLVQHCLRLPLDL